VRHQVKTMMRQQVLGMCTGDEDLNDVEEPGSDKN
jgi:hypothetical protein